MTFDWLATAGITGITRRIKHISWLFEPSVKLDPLPSTYTVQMPDGSALQPDLLKAAARAEFEKIPFPVTKGPVGKKTIIFPTPGLVLYDEGSGTSYPIGRAIVDVCYELIEEFIPFRLVSYRDSASGETITNAAVADMTLGDVSGQMMIVYKESEGGRIVFIPRKDGGTQ